MTKFFTILAMVLGFYASAQTEEEYNYLTKGLKIQLESGLDMKKGYTLEPIKSHHTTGGIQFDFQFLLNNYNERVAISVIFNYPDKRQRFACVPLKNTEMYNKYLTFVNTLSESEARQFAFALTSILHYTVPIEMYNSIGDTTAAPEPAPLVKQKTKAKKKKN